MTEYEATIAEILEDYFTNNNIEYDKNDRNTSRISKNLYDLIYYVFRNVPDQSVTRVLTLTMSYGAKKFTNYVDIDELDGVIDDSLGNLSKRIQGDVFAEYDLIKYRLPRDIYLESIRLNWSDRKSAVSCNYYYLDFVNDIIFKLHKLGFDGRYGPKLSREFIMLLGLRHSKLISTMDIHKNIVVITDNVVNILNKMIDDRINGNKWQ